MTAAGVLFDLDGVLLDSEGSYTDFWTAMDKRFPTGVDNFAHVIKGSNLHKILGGYFPDEDVRRQVCDLLDEFQVTMQYEFFPGALDFVGNLRAHGVAVALVTSSDKNKMEAVYAQHPQFKSLFDVIITGDMVHRAKPDPECFVTAARLLGLDAAACVVFEDSIHGLHAARAAGAHVVGVATTLSADVIAPLCDEVIAGFADC